MKVSYSPEILNFITATKELFPANIVPSYVSASEREFYSWPDGLHTLIQHGIQKSLAVTATRDSKIERFKGVSCSISTIINPTSAEVTFNVNKGFLAREDLLAWVEEHQLTLPTECTKDGVLDDQKIKTMITHKIIIDDLTLSLFYIRDGAPTTKCRIETGTYSTVVCDLAENTTNDDSVPF